MCKLELSITEAFKLKRLVDSYNRVTTASRNSRANKITKSVVYEPLFRIEIDESGPHIVYLPAHVVNIPSVSVAAPISVPEPVESDDVEDEPEVIETPVAPEPAKRRRGRPSSK